MSLSLSMALEPRLFYEASLFVEPGGDVVHVAICGACVVYRRHRVHAYGHGGKLCLRDAAEVCGQCRPIYRWDRVLTPHVNCSKQRIG